MTSEREFEEWLAKDEGVTRFGLELRESWVDGARAGWQAARQDWQPISDAPTDGTHIIGLRDGEVSVVAFTNGGDENYLAEWWDVYGDQPASPHYWMPLPPAPKGGCDGI